MREHDELIDALATHRRFLRQTLRDIGEDAARATPTVSVLTLASLVKHVADTEEQWITFARTGSMSGGGESSGEDTRFLLRDTDTVATLLARYDEVAAATEEFLAHADLDVAHPLPSAPWFQPGASWSVRRMVVHVLAETAQHAGHADIIRESIDGARTMG
ncbi:DinB family protein [Williamsia sp. CHRR-6]|uniref:DinB family protein n=1 Tax=Williamsia sp. CHRR-6 TaxID=2835871 RepID=UPI001BDA55CA|nr:DinB family protein [Williamsia sp. CHRR-6]MBT0567624.1 DinB family protein [Williamsia sp. CHRR-6]